MADLNVFPTESEPSTPAPVLRPADEEPHISSEIREENIFQSLIANIRDAFFAPKLPPLVLESKPIAVADLMATKRSPTSTAVAVGIHALVIGLIAWLIAAKVPLAAPVKLAVTSLLEPPPPPPVMPKDTKIGGGGGQHDLGPVTQGHLPK
ncbi:MAG TPA: hypothetical protein VN734_05460, partial [Acidobacteriaceae bacterium]|nr:hypothetical protein [Acidobacteriaceae bacterium]